MAPAPGKPAGRAPASGRRVGALLGAVALAGCATTMPADVGQQPADPYEAVNRRVFEFNDRLDRAVLKPVAQGYARLPGGLRRCVGNVFANLADLPGAVNNLLQGKPGDALGDLGRVAINTTIGLGGCFDVASEVGLERRAEDFGQTLGTWGAATGPYLVLPLFGPSNVRDAFGTVVDFNTDPLGYLSPSSHAAAGSVVRVVDLRAGLLDAEKILNSAALDRYRFTRDAFLQRRRSLVYDGNPPPPPLDEAFDDPPEDEPAPEPTEGAAAPTAAPPPASSGPDQPPADAAR